MQNHAPSGQTDLGGGRQQRKQGVTLSLIAGVVAVILVVTLVGAGALEALELRTHDLRFALRGSRRSASQRQIVIAAITDTTEEEWREPRALWGTHLARGIEQARAAGAEWVALDVIPAANSDEFLEESGASQAHPDRDLLNAIRNARGHVILSSVLPGSLKSAKPVLPNRQIMAMPEAAPYIGFANLPDQQDESVRTLPLFVRGANETILPGFAALTAARAGAARAEETDTALSAFARRPAMRDGNAQFWVNYTGRTFAKIDFENLAKGALTDEQRTMLHGSIVLIGDRTTGSGDIHRTQDGYLPGVDVQAEGIATLLDGAALGRWPGWVEAAWSLFFGLGALAACRKWSVSRSAALLAVAAVAWLLVSQAAFQWRFTLVPVAGPLLAIGATWLVIQSVHAAEESYRRLQVEAIFGRNVDPGIRDYLLENPSRMALGGRMCEASIFFFDIRGFTAYASECDPARVMGELNVLLKELAPAVSKHGGLLAKYMGDGFMAIFGVPKPDPDHASAALAAARDVLDSLEEVNRRRVADGLPAWKAGCGVHSGPVVAGNVGSADRSEFTVIGATVNLAARLQDATKEQSVPLIVSEETLSRISQEVAGGVRKEISVRGMGEVCVRLFER